MARVERSTLIAPDRDRATVTACVERNFERRLSRSLERQLFRAEARDDEREPGRIPLCQETSVVRDDHPLAVVLQPGIGQQRATERRAAARLDRVDVEAGQRDGGSR